jgi:hypothetical protein
MSGLSHRNQRTLSFLRCISGQLPAPGIADKLAFGSFWSTIAHFSLRSREHATNGHYLFGDLAFSQISVINPRLAIQRKSRAGNGAALVSFTEMPPRELNLQKNPNFLGNSKDDASINALDFAAFADLSRVIRVRPGSRIAPKVLLPGRGCKQGRKDTLRQKSVLPWAEWIRR